MAFLVAPSLLSADFSRLGQEIETVEKAGADWIHLDIMDSHFVPNLTFGAPVVKKLRPLSVLPFDVHLMVSHPERHIEHFARAGADYLTFHIESQCDPLAAITAIKKQGMKAGVSLKPATPLDSLKPLLSEVDLVLIMTVEPGQGGQDFLKSQAQKVTDLKNHIAAFNNPPLIEVDGGITPKTQQLVKEADVLVSGTYIFKSGNYAKAIASLKNTAF